jgi:predicted RNA polymerase sigma factor
MSAESTNSAIETVWRIESARLIAGLTRYVRDVGLAEDLAQEALVAALEQWPAEGIPRNPGAWLMGTAKHRAIDHFRRNERLARKTEELGRDLEAPPYVYRLPPSALSGGPGGPDSPLARRPHDR